MRITIDIRDELERRARKKAADDGEPFREVVEAALRRHLSGNPKESGYKLRRTTGKGEKGSPSAIRSRMTTSTKHG